MARLEAMRDHWWWRPGWQVGRSFYTWHITFADQQGAHELVSAYAPALYGLSGLDPVPVKWMHLTMQGIGFTDEVDRATVDKIVDRARMRCEKLSPFKVTIGPARVDPETVQMPVQPVEPLVELRATIRAAIGDVWGADNVPENPDAYRPHVSLAYSNAAGPSEPIAERLATNSAHTREVTVGAVTLIDLNRNHRAYEWSDVATVALGGDQLHA